jgi:hypothetical protein
MKRIKSFHSFKQINEELDASRRKFLKNLATTAVVGGLSGSALKTVIDWIRNSYSEEADELRDAYELRLSKEGRRFISAHYEDYVPGFEDKLKVAEAEIINIFEDWTTSGIQNTMNQKMYDALVLICFRVGRKNFRMSKFIQQIKKSNYIKAVELLQSENIETLWNCAKPNWVKKYELMLLSSFDSGLSSKVDELEEEETASTDEEEIQKPMTAGETTTKAKVKDGLVQLKETNYKNVKHDLDATKNDFVSKALLDDLQTAAERAGVVVTITTAKSGHSIFTIFGTESRHRKNIAVDIAILNGEGSGGAYNAISGNPNFRKWGNELKDELVNLGYSWNSESGNDKAVLWQTNKGGNHFNHLHVSRKK